MYIPRSFQESRIEILHQVIREHSFATLVSNVNSELFATHMPFLLDPESGEYGRLVGHMARANPHWRSFVENPAAESLVIFQGPHAYISPGWYESEVAVPTWNYVAVHVYGVPRIVDDAAQVRALLEATVQKFEAPLPTQWSVSLVPEAYITSMTMGIVAFEMPISRLEGKRKLGQNRPEEDRAGAAAGLRHQGDPLSVAVAELMSENMAP